MTRHPRRFVRSIVSAVFLLSLGILFSLPGTAIADLLARAAGEEAAESIAPHPPQGGPISPERLERWRAMPPRSASGSGSGTAGGRRCPRKSGSGSWSGTVDGGSSPRSSGAT